MKNYIVFSFLVLVINFYLLKKFNGSNWFFLPYVYLVIVAVLGSVEMWKEVFGRF